MRSKINALDCDHDLRKCWKSIFSSHFPILIPNDLKFSEKFQIKYILRIIKKLLSINLRGRNGIIKSHLYLTLAIKRSSDHKIVFCVLKCLLQAISKLTNSLWPRSHMYLAIYGYKCHIWFFTVINSDLYHEYEV